MIRFVIMIMIMIIILKCADLGDAVIEMLRGTLDR